MPEFPISPEVAMAAKAIEAHRFPDGSPPGISGAHAEELASAVLDKLGLREERAELHQAPDGTMLYKGRLVSDWRQVDAESQVYETGLGQVDVVGASVRVDTEPSEPTEVEVRAAAKAMLRVRFPNARWESTPLKRCDKMMREARETIAAYLAAVNGPSATSEGER